LYVFFQIFYCLFGKNLAHRFVGCGILSDSEVVVGEADSEVVGETDSGVLLGGMGSIGDISVTGGLDGGLGSGVEVLKVGGLICLFGGAGLVGTD